MTSKNPQANAEAKPANPGYSHSDQVTFPAYPHALPFRTILGEHFARRPHDLARVSADIFPVKQPPPFNPQDHDSRSAWGKFSNQQWRLLLQHIQDSENAYRELAAQKETLAALSVRDWVALAAEHNREISRLVQEIDALNKEIGSTPPDRRQELLDKKAEKEKQLLAERQGKKDDRFQAQIAAGYQKVLAAEEKCKDADNPLVRVLHGMNASAVCLSGGGIRSASFCLGVLQGLSRFSVKRDPKPDSTWRIEGVARSALEGLDYLSTVSGGGYIGSWLMAWASHARYENVVKLLARPADTATDPEPQPLRHLREYTSYLTPQYGFTLDTMTLLAIVLRNLVLNWMILVPAVVLLFCVPEFFYQASAFVPLSLSGWVPTASVAIATILESWALLFVARSNFKPYYASETKNPQDLGRTSREVLQLILPLMAGAWILAEGWAWANQPNNHAVVTTNSSLTEIALHFAWFAVAPPMLMALARIALLFPRLDAKNDSPLRRHQPGDSNEQPSAAQGGNASAFGQLFRWIRIVDWLKFLWALIAPFLIGVSVAFALAACAKYIPMPDWIVPQTRYQATRWFVWLCIPVIWSVLLLASAILSGLLSGIETEEEREWWARAGGLIMMVELGCIALLGLSYFAGIMVSALVGGILVAAGLASGYVGSLAGLSAATTSGLKKVKLDQLTSAQKWLSKHNLIAPAACAIAVLCLSFALAAMTSWFRGAVYALLQNAPQKMSVSTCEPVKHGGAAAEAVVRLPDPAAANKPSDESGVSWAVRQVLLAVKLDTCFLGADPFDQPLHDSSEMTAKFKKNFVANLVVALIAFVIAMLANWFINVNTFSLHGMYRMRLMRAYLGASNFARHADNFTNFDKRDNLYEADVAYHHAPLHIINTALNVVATRNLAWQQRKAESFTFSPLSAGSWRLGYLPTALYGGSKGVTLGTAMSISGAAFNPNMGYHSSPLVTLLMTFFNARLGWWLPNPIWPVLKTRKSNSDNADPKTSSLALESLLESRPGLAKYLRRAGPTGALFTLISEALGRTDDKYKWIELTDGGHFENLALYEMVMRRCRYVILVDSGADGDYEFEDLGNAVRKIEIDFGVPVRFPKYSTGLPMKRGIDGSNVYYALGEILYDCVDKDPKSSASAEQQGIHNGKLLYIKPCLNGSEPLGVRAYANAHPKFPHESTVNQFFNEAQFESYRNLGSWEFASIVREFLDDPLPPGNDIESLFDCVNQAAAPANKEGPGLWVLLKSALDAAIEGDFKSAAKPPDKNPSSTA